MEPVTDMPHATPDTSTALSGEPDWNVITREIACPLCEYNLRGLTQPRCPECGYQFDWHILLNEQNHDHPYLFEQHPRRNVWSFWKTAVGGLRPWKFWSSLRPDQTSRPRRLIAYWIIAMLGALFLLSLTCIGYWVEDTTRNNANSRIPISMPTGPSLGGYRYVPYRPAPRSYVSLTEFWYQCQFISKAFLGGWTVAVIWPWLTAAILMIFRVSMRRAKVRPIHTLRCVLYSADIFLWAALATAVVSWLTVASAILDSSYGDDRKWLAVMIWSGIIIALFPAIKLCVAYQKYLRFRHAWATIIASQIILFLVIMVVIAQLQEGGLLR